MLPSTGDAPHYNGKCQQTGKLWTLRAGQILIGRLVSWQDGVDMLHAWYLTLILVLGRVVT